MKTQTVEIFSVVNDELPWPPQARRENILRYIHVKTGEKSERHRV